MTTHKYEIILDEKEIGLISDTFASQVENVTDMIEKSSPEEIQRNDYNAVLDDLLKIQRKFSELLNIFLEDKTAVGVKCYPVFREKNG